MGKLPLSKAGPMGPPLSFGRAGRDGAAIPTPAGLSVVKERCRQSPACRDAIHEPEMRILTKTSSIVPNGLSSGQGALE